MTSRPFRFFFTFATLTLLPLCILAQRTALTGYVSDKTNGDPLPGAYVIIQAIQKGTTTDSEGMYNLKLPPGQYVVKYSFLGYKDTSLTVSIVDGKETIVDVTLVPDVIVGQEVVVDAGRLGNKVRQLARLRDSQKKGLESWTADVYKLAILSSVLKAGEVDTLDGKPVAFAERTSRIDFVAPNKYLEYIRGRRSSKNFFSEYDFFSTGGSPLDLNQNRVAVSILSEDISVVGPISVNARKFYDFEEIEAGPSWPAGTTELRIKPNVDNKPLFFGTVWLAADGTSILGIDVTLNKYADTDNGLFRVTGLRYVQTYIKQGEFWLPEKTEMSANIKIIGSKKEIFYKDVWTWSNYKVNQPSLARANVPLSGEILNPLADKRDESYWKELSGARAKNPNADALEQAEQYEEKRVTIKAGMFVMRTFFRLPYQLENFYFTNFNDFYRFNKVEGHFLGLGLRTPQHRFHEYRLTGGAGTSEGRFRYRAFGLQHLGKTGIAPEVDVYRQLNLQFLDYEYNPTPIDFTESRNTVVALFLGLHTRHFFEREGHTAGLRLRWGPESFLRVLYVNEQHRQLFERTRFNVFGLQVDSLQYRNNIPGFETQNGRLTGMYLHLHHDTRKYLRYQFLRDYDTREIGWLSDVWYEWGVPQWGSDFNYHRYRAAFMLNLPAFSSHFFQMQLVLGASDGNTPHQRMFTYNGTVYDDYYRERPFLTVPFYEPIGYRSTLVRLRYKFGSSVTRKAPVDFIRKSGIRLSTFVTAGWVDQNTSLAPLIPGPGVTPQVEVGIAVARIFSAFYVELSQRVVGDYGNRIGFIFLF